MLPNAGFNSFSLARVSDASLVVLRKGGERLEETSVFLKKS